MWERARSSTRPKQSLISSTRRLKMSISLIHLFNNIKEGRPGFLWSIIKFDLLTSSSANKEAVQVRIKKMVITAITEDWIQIDAPNPDILLAAGFLTIVGWLRWSTSSQTLLVTFPLPLSNSKMLTGSKVLINELELKNKKANNSYWKNNERIKCLINRKS